MASPFSRRKFLAQTAKGSIALSVSGISSTLLSSHSTKASAEILQTGFTQTPLPYAYKALEPVIDALTMEIHYTKHAAAYSKNLIEAADAEQVDKKTPLEQLMTRISKYSEKMRNNGGGHFNHELFWKLMKPGNASEPTGIFLKSITDRFGSLEAFKTEFAKTALSRFGSGWAWLVVDGDKKLQIGSTPNQDNPLMDVSSFKGTPIVGLDVWEHAYYLKYQNRRADYIANWWNVANWSYATDRFDAAVR